MKTMSLIAVVSALSMGLAGCGGGVEGEPAEREVTASEGPCYVWCDDGRSIENNNIGSVSACQSYAYNFCYPYGGSARFGSEPQDTW
ncbi:hypothetical protein [Vitiosangium sp. GDMCC 1.1324]|uniref:hypothetical protein n=1 Tax=Vitiosangium sp. (strain GDMCC 1.1324) TaxID=2138576 RepID=UPI000D367B9E|nr:hypothetical protein [Vitiosangium sp. GDMCC 1.1324]PTL81986.1 hypothetical protein DAT35_19420 [Vitiosangium sp. GDMCC 1.1324]